MNTETDKLVDSHYAAAYLGVATQTMATWRARGIGPAYIYLSPEEKTKAGVRYRMSELDSFHTQWKIDTARNPRNSGTTRNEKDRYPFLRGFASCICDAIRVGLPMGEARRIMVAWKLDYDLFDRAGCQPADLRKLRDALRSPLAKAKPGDEPLGGDASGRGRKPVKC